MLLHHAAELLCLAVTHSPQKVTVLVVDGHAVDHLGRIFLRGGVHQVGCSLQDQTGRADGALLHQQAGRGITDRIDLPVLLAGQCPCGGDQLVQLHAGKFSPERNACVWHLRNGDPSVGAGQTSHLLRRCAGEFVGAVIALQIIAVVKGGEGHGTVFRAKASLQHNAYKLLLATVGHRDQVTDLRYRKLAVFDVSYLAGQLSADGRLIARPCPIRQDIRDVPGTGLGFGQIDHHADPPSKTVSDGTCIVTPG